MMGLSVEGILDGSHATIFKKVENKKINWWAINHMIIVSKICFSIVDTVIAVLRPIKRFLFK